MLKMGLFSRKKKIEVPIPPPKNLLKFPKPSQVERVIEPEKIKEAVGIEKPTLPLPESLEKLEKPKLTFPTPPETFPSTIRPFFIRVQYYQKILDDLDHIKKNTTKLDKTVETLEKSEFNESKNYEKLKNNLKKIHERLLFMDELIFKSR